MIKGAILGPPQTGKSTLFSLLTEYNYQELQTKRANSNITGISKVKDERVEEIFRLLSAKKKVLSEIKYLLTSPLNKDSKKNGQIWSSLNECNFLIYIIDNFSLKLSDHDLKKNIESISLELSFSDLEIIENRLERIKKKNQRERKEDLLKEKDILKKCKESLEKNSPIRNLSFTEDEKKIIRGFQFFTQKPLLILINSSEDNASPSPISKNISQGNNNLKIDASCLKLEWELNQIEDITERKTLANEWQIEKNITDKINKIIYNQLNFITFFTTDSGEVRAWAIKNGSTAVDAGGLIHTDMAKGFIRVESINYKFFKKVKSLAVAKEKGLINLKSKDYQVQDGDILHFRFNV
jgi:ribosome-binding ATPase YchF (GTP1/OBG family)